MNAKLLFKSCLAEATNVIGQVVPARFGDPTPDTDWDVRALVAHILCELSWVPDVIAGSTVAEVGQKHSGDLIGHDLPRNWQTAADKALRAVNQTELNRTVHLSYGEFTAEHYIGEQANDQLIHAWDLGTAIGVSVKFDESIAQELYLAAWPRRHEMAASGLFAPAIDVADSADIQTKLLALFGRRAT